MRKQDLVPRTFLKEKGYRLSGAYVPGLVVSKTDTNDFRNSYDIELIHLSI